MTFCGLELPEGVDRPGMIYCVGVNYPDRNEEYHDGKEAPPYPSLFPRSTLSFVANGEPLIMSPESPQYDYEGEVTLIIGKEGRRIPCEKAREHIFGLTLCNEGCYRDWLRHAKFNVTQGKNWDKSGSLGPRTVPIDEIEDLNNIDLECWVNGELRQKDNTSRMTFPIDYLVNYISTFTTLMPGDIIVTGTPTGAGARFDPPKWLVPGDEVIVKSPQLGELKNIVQAEG
jgi:2-keto-4-pentenoate hydratase/2-oxohepta-3-ene-1,7-dioic acid hydratase in catechol pathway